MKSRLLPCCGLLILLSVVWGFQAVTTPVAPQADERLTLSTPHRDYLLGEPVLLDLTFRNTSKETIKVVEHFGEPYHYEAMPWIAQNGQPFQESCPNFATRCIVGRRVFTLAPQEHLSYKYRVVGAPWPQFRLAFAKPGDYRVYVVYPLTVVGAKQNAKIASNVVNVHVKKPVGEDSQVWRKLNDSSFLTLLQVDAELTEEHRDVTLKMAEILAAHPKSGYAPALRHALSKVSPGLHHRLTFEQTVWLEEILGLKGFVRPEEDPKDKRLDAIRKDSYERQTTVAHVLRSLSKASGVPLDTSPELKMKGIRMADSQTSVRACMSGLRGLWGGSWERRGDGYFLVPFQASAAKPPAEKGKEDD